MAHWMKYYRALKSHDGAGGRRHRRSRPRRLPLRRRARLPAGRPGADREVDRLRGERRPPDPHRAHRTEGPPRPFPGDALGGADLRTDRRHASRSTTCCPAPSKATSPPTAVRYAWGSWADILEPQPGTTTLATYADQFYAGKAAAVTHKLGKGTVTYIGVDTAERRSGNRRCCARSTPRTRARRRSSPISWSIGATASGSPPTSPRPRNPSRLAPPPSC